MRELSMRRPFWAAWESWNSRGCYELAGSAVHVEPVNGFVFHMARASPLRPPELPRNGFVAMLSVCLSSTRNGERRTSAIPPVKPMHHWHWFITASKGASTHPSKEQIRKCPLSQERE